MVQRLLSRNYSHPYRTFRQAVRKFRPSDLLPALAVESLHSESDSERDFTERPPWAMAAIARESVLYGNEHRSAKVESDTVRRLTRSFAQVYERDERGPALQMLTRIAHEQFPYQESDWAVMGRSKSLLVDGLADVEGLEVMSDEAMTSLLGTTLNYAVGTTFALYAGAQLHNGWIDPRWFDQANFIEILGEVPRSAFEATIARRSGTIADLKSYPSPPTEAGLERYGFNVLSAKPLLKWPDGRLLLPVPRLLLWSVTPGSLYYLGVEKFGEAFTRDLGRLVEHYVGRQAALTDAVIVPEIEYETPRGRARSVDYFLIWDDLVVLVEVKSTRLRVSDKAGAKQLTGQLDRIIREAKSQIARSAVLARDRHPDFERIPADRRMMGLVVTAEPIYMANSGLYQPPMVPDEIDTQVASLSDLEHLVVLPKGARQHLLALLDDPERRRWYMSSAFGEADTSIRNPILDAAWDSYPFADWD